MLNPKLAVLQKRVSSVQKKASGPRPPIGGSMASRGSRGANYALIKLKRIALMRSKHPINNEVASKLNAVFEGIMREELHPPTGSPDSDHQILTNAASALLKAEGNDKVVELSQRQMDVLFKYTKMLRRME
jgi:hypothetical protein